MKTQHPITKIVVATIMLGIIGLSLNIVFGMNTVTYLSTYTVNGITFYKYDFWNYIENIRNTFTNVAQLELHLPTDEWQNTANFLQDIAHNLAYILNRILIGLNVLLYPIRIIFYAVQMILSFIGIPTIQGTYEQNSLKWLIDTTKVLTNLQIPYVNT